MSDIIWTRLSQMRDAEALMELDKLVWVENTSPTPIVWNSREHYLQKCPPGTQMVAGVGDRICGYVGFDYPTPLESNRHVYELNIAVHPDYQGRGIGRTLMEAIKEMAAERGVRKLCLRVLASNPGGLAFYKKCGFVEQGRLVEEFWIGGRYVDDILMWCPVASH